MKREKGRGQFIIALVFVQKREPCAAEGRWVCEFMRARWKGERRGLRLGGIDCRLSGPGVGWIVIATDVQRTARGGTPLFQRTAPQREGARGGIWSCHSKILPPLSHPPGDWTRSPTDSPTKSTGQSLKNYRFLYKESKRKGMKVFHFLQYPFLQVPPLQ